ncbi:uncharacterized protein BDZ99DRAFT_468973 [Mytilinidion resinicola]|uniref:Uncharacterized protein n=1 Tax=Mytilinidion resinicola TaxID=574789 RepID=A0A6A6Y1L2_9PEZI|nr:uncharacterized protein BDZ99DRAFT_468973 [Mytilinidion resinicola]KAF2802529.1 hypothetical protein BDZ99DRAFT_468973 [Mytilinidion resinicola]
MTPTTLLTLPTEMRQKIISLTITTKYRPPTKEAAGRSYLSSPVKGVCKTLKADFKEITLSWLPDPITASLPPVQQLQQLFTLRRMNKYFIEREKSSNRSWPGMQVLRIQLVNFGDATIAQQLPQSLMKLRSEDRGILSQMVDFQFLHLRHFPVVPTTVRRLEIDLTLPPEASALLDTIVQMDAEIPKRTRKLRAKVKELDWQFNFWRQLWEHAEDIAYRLVKQDGAPSKLAVKVIGSIRERQLEFIAREMRLRHFRKSGGLVDFREYLEKVRAREAELSLEREETERRLKLVAEEKAMKARRQSRSVRGRPARR